MQETTKLCLRQLATRFFDGDPAVYAVAEDGWRHEAVTIYRSGSQNQVTHMTLIGLISEAQAEEAAQHYLRAEYPAPQFTVSVAVIGAWGRLELATQEVGRLVLWKVADGPALPGAVPKRYELEVAITDHDPAATTQARLSPSAVFPLFGCFFREDLTAKQLTYVAEDQRAEYANRTFSELMSFAYLHGDAWGGMHGNRFRDRHATGTETPEEIERYKLYGTLRLSDGSERTLPETSAFFEQVKASIQPAPGLATVLLPPAAVRTYPVQELTRERLAQELGSGQVLSYTLPSGPYQGYALLFAKAEQDGFAGVGLPYGISRVGLSPVNPIASSIVRDTRQQVFYPYESVPVGYPADLLFGPVLLVEAAVAQALLTVMGR